MRLSQIGIDTNSNDETQDVNMIEIESNFVTETISDAHAL